MNKLRDRFLLIGGIICIVVAIVCFVLLGVALSQNGTIKL